MKTNPSTRDLLLQLWLHTKVFKGRFCSAFSQQPRAATAACWGKAGSFSQTPLSPTSSDPWNSGLLHIFISLLPHIIQEPLAAEVCVSRPLWGQNSTAAGATTPHPKHPPDFLWGDWQQGDAGCYGSCLTAAVWKQNSEAKRALWAWDRMRRDMSTLHGASLQVYTGLQLKRQPRLNAWKLAS